MGGLGNQLFQLNYCEFMKQEKGIDLRISDTLVRKNVHTRLLNWKIHDYIIPNLMKNLETETISFSLAPYLAKSRLLPGFSRYYGVKDFPDALTARHNFGYFQNSVSSNVYLKNNLALGDSYNNADRIVVHLRLTDNNWLDDSIRFYEREIEHVSNKALLICTDDKQKACEILKKIGADDFEFSDGTVEDDFKILCNADHKILSISSFSWWVAKLSSDRSEIVMPEQLAQLFGKV